MEVPLFYRDGNEEESSEEEFFPQIRGAPVQVMTVLILSHQKNCKKKQMIFPFIGCFEKTSLSKGCNVARNKARRVNAFCNECEDRPNLCITALLRSTMNKMYRSSPFLFIRDILLQKSCYVCFAFHAFVNNYFCARIFGFQHGFYFSIYILLFFFLAFSMEYGRVGYDVHAESYIIVQLHRIRISFLEFHIYVLIDKMW